MSTTKSRLTNCIVLVGLLVLILGAQKAVAQQCDGLRGWARLNCEARRIPGHVDLRGLIDRLLTEWIEPDKQPITTSFADSRYADTLPETFNPGPFIPLRALGRSSEGNFLLQAGAYEGVLQSFCLHAGSYGPSQGTGYCPAPLRGSKAGVVRTILQQSVFHPEIPQQQIQLLLWAILARADYQHLGPQLQQTAATLLPADQLEGLKSGPWNQMSDELRRRADAALQEKIAEMMVPVERARVQAERNIREQFAAGAPYEVIERIAVLAALSEVNSSSIVPRGIWVKHPQGYYVRYLPQGYARTTVQIYVPETATAAARSARLETVSINSQAAGDTPLVFDPTEELAMPASNGSRRLALTSRSPDAAPSCPATYLSVAAGYTYVARPATLMELPKVDFWDLFWEMFDRVPAGAFIAGVFAPSEIADDELENALTQCPPLLKEKEPDCQKANTFQLKQAGIYGIEHEIKTAYNAVPTSRFDLCACKDGKIVIKAVNSCGTSAPVFDVTDYRWK